MQSEEDKIKNNELSPKMRAMYEKPQNTWFFERTGDGFIFAANEKEASDICYNRTNWMRRDFKLLGMSDGTTYKKVAQESAGKSLIVRNKIATLEYEIAKYRKTEERFVFDELLPITDPKVIQVKKILADLESDLEVLQIELKGYTTDVAKTAFAAELEVARGNIKWPPRNNVITPGASSDERNKILRSMGQL